MYGAFMAVGWVASRKSRDGTAADLIVAGRSMPLWIAALTMTATWVDGGYLLGTTEGAYKNSIQLGIQGGLCFGISLILGGLFFAGIMRRFGFTTLIDPFEARFGKRWAAVLFLPALAGELFWSAELLVAIGSTFGVLLGMKLTTAILLAAVVTTAYTMLGGMWSVAYTDIFQLAIVAIGLCVALPFVLDGAGGLHHAWDGVYRRPTRRRRYRAAVSAAHRSLEPRVHGRLVGHVADADASAAFRGTATFSACSRAERRVRRAGSRCSSGVLTIAFTIPPLLMGVAGVRLSLAGRRASRGCRRRRPKRCRCCSCARCRRSIGLLGLAAIVGAVTLELQLLDPVGGIDVELELPEAPGLAGALGRPDEARDPLVDSALRRDRDRAGARRCRASRRCGSSRAISCSCCCSRS